MNDYDKALMDFYAKVLAAGISTGEGYLKAEIIAKTALKDFKKLFPQPDFRNKAEG